jgi:DNA-binding transcriptional MerR regulator
MMIGVYRIQEFAEQAGVTVRALHHYDRLGLLKPERTDAGYRAYGPRDLERLEQIVALRFLGVPLKRIRTLLERNAVPLGEALRYQRTVLLEKRRQLDRAIAAIGNAERAIEAGRPAEAAMLQNIVEAIRMQDNVEFRRKYFSEAAWARLTQLREENSEAAAMRRW